MIAKLCAECKQHFAPWVRNSLRMAQNDINQVVARSLRWYMDQAETTEKALGAKAGVSARTVANFLRPENRVAGSRGKEPSGTLTELARIADALHITVADLVIDETNEAREDRRRLMTAAEILRTGKSPGAASSKQRHAA